MDIEGQYMMTAPAGCLVPHTEGNEIITLAQKRGR